MHDCSPDGSEEAPWPPDAFGPVCDGLQPGGERQVVSISAVSRDTPTRWM